MSHLANEKMRRSIYKIKQDVIEMLKSVGLEKILIPIGIHTLVVYITDALYEAYDEGVKYGQNLEKPSKIRAKWGVDN